MSTPNTGHRQRLKDRFLAGEASARTDKALLELLLTYALPQRDTQPLARDLLARRSVAAIRARIGLASTDSL